MVSGSGHVVDGSLQGMVASDDAVTPINDVSNDVAPPVIRYTQPSTVEG